MPRQMRVLALLFIIIAVGVLGCGQDNSDPVAAPPPKNSTADIPGIDPESQIVTSAKGWSNIVITANMAKTDVGAGAHFATTRNACGKDAYGALSLESWNNLAKNANLSVQGLTRDPDYC